MRTGTGGVVELRQGRRATTQVYRSLGKRYSHCRGVSVPVLAANPVSKIGPLIRRAGGADRRARPAEPIPIKRMELMGQARAAQGPPEGDAVGHGAVPGGCVKRVVS